MCSATAGSITIEDLPRRFGVEQLYDHQHEAITSVVSGRDVMLVAPTGAGKSEGLWGFSQNAVGPIELATHVLLMCLECAAADF